MAGVQQLEAPVNAGAGAGATGASLDNLTSSLGLVATKRQRRPSVRLGDIGDQPATLAHDPFLRRTKQWSDYGKYRFSFQKDPAGAAKGSKTRPLTNLSNGGESHEVVETEDKDVIIGGGGGGGGDGNFDLLGIGNRKAKRGLPAKRPRSNWMASASSKGDEGGIIGEEKLSGEEEGGGGAEAFRDFNVEGSESPLKEQSPLHCLENPVAIDSRQNSGEGVFSGQRRAVSTRARFSESRDHDGIELDGPSDTDARDWKCGISLDGNGGIEKGTSWSLEDGILMWLNGLGLGRYLPVFEIHEVDEEVLPLLTLEDLKDMGINAVGSRRKLYSAIQKLAKGFS